MSSRDPAAPHGMGDIERAVHDGIRNRIEPARAYVLGARNKIASRVVNEAGERAGGKDFLDHGVDGLRVPDVHAKSGDLAAMPPHQLCAGLLANGLAPPADEDLRAKAQETAGHRLAQARAAACDKNALAFEQALFEHCFSRVRRLKRKPDFLPGRAR